MLPVEVNLQSCRVAKQETLSAEDYIEAMMDKMDNVPESRLKVLEEIEKEKLRVANA
jgi:hypothetical protein